MTLDTLAAPALPPPSTAELGDHVRALREQVGRAFIGQAEVFDQVLLALLATGHVLIEGVPGLGKTLLVRALAASVGCTFGRVQFTPDLMPADVTGHAIYDPKTERFQIRRGPVFANLLLADEINRATPKTQSALLEAMAEGQVTVDGTTHALPQPFFVVATQNPLDLAGTFPLPDSQLDRFMLRLSLDYPDPAAERELLTGIDRLDLLAILKPQLDGAALLALRRQAQAIVASPALLDYLQALLAASRRHAEIRTGLSPRAGLSLLAVARAWALLDGRAYVLPEDLQALFVPLAAHRLVAARGTGGEALARQLLAEVAVD